MRRAALLGAVLLLGGCGAGNREPPDAGEVERDAGSTGGGSAGGFAFYLSDSCRSVGSDVDGVAITLEDVTGVTTKHMPEMDKPWCQRLTPAVHQTSDARGAYSAAGRLALEVSGNTITITGSSEASASATTRGSFAQGEAGFTSLDIRGGGGGVTRGRITVSCAGTITHSMRGVPGIHVERCNGTPVCSRSVDIPGLPAGWQGTGTTFEETTDSPASVLGCLRVRFTSLAANDATASASGTIVITVTPL